MKYIIFFFTLSIVIYYIVRNKLKKEIYSNVLDEYYFNNKYNNNKKIWIHIDDINVYQNLCIESIIYNCKDKYQIILFKDKDINEILNNDIDYGSISGDELLIYRNISFLNILHLHGGVFLPSYLYLTKSIENIDVDKFYVSQITNQGKNISMNNMVHSIEIMGSNKNNPILLDYIEKYTSNCKDNYTQDCIKYGRQILKDMDIPFIDGKIIGCKDIKNNPLYLEDLMENKEIELHISNIGLYIPHYTLKTRKNYNWYCYLNRDELLNTNVYISKYILEKNII